MDRQQALKQERWWILNVICYPREDDGRIKALPPARQAVRQSGEEMFVGYWIGLGVPEHKARALWKKQRQEAGEAQAERERLARGLNGR